MDRAAPGHASELLYPGLRAAPLRPHTARLIDAASLRTAEGLLRKLVQIEAREVAAPVAAVNGRAFA